MRIAQASVLRLSFCDDDVSADGGLTHRPSSADRPENSPQKRRVPPVRAVTVETTLVHRLRLIHTVATIWASCIS